MQIVVECTVDELYEIERKLRVPSRAVDMGRCLNVDVSREYCDQMITIVIYRRPGDNWVGYSSPFSHGNFLLSSDAVKRYGNKIRPELVELFVPKELR